MLENYDSKYPTSISIKQVFFFLSNIRQGEGSLSKNGGKETKRADRKGITKRAGGNWSCWGRYPYNGKVGRSERGI
jgi:hypothetical protein